MYVRDSLRYEVLYPTLFGAIFEVLWAKSALSASLWAYLQLLFTIRLPSAECNRLFDFKLLVRVAIKNLRPSF